MKDPVLYQDLTGCFAIKWLSMTRLLLTYKLFYKFLGVAGFDEIFAKHLLQAEYVTAAVMFKHDDFLKAVSVPQ